MRTTTNLDAIRNCAKDLLYTDITTDKEFPPELVVYHPYISSSCYVKDREILDLLHNEKALEDYRQNMCQIIDRNDFTSNSYLIRKPYRLTYLKLCLPYLSAIDLASNLGNMWTDSENPNADCNCSIAEILDWFKQADKEALMTEEEFKVFSNLPDTITLYRGISKHGIRRGMSWTHSLEIAEWFSNRFKEGNGLVLETKVHKDDILCYFSRRNEDEYIIDPRKIKFRIL